MDLTTCPVPHNCSVTPLTRKDFWEVYETHRSPGDGLYLLHSVISALRLQTHTELTMSELIYGIIDEIFIKSSDYIHLMDVSVYAFHKGLNAYIYEKVYNTSFSDLVPQIIAHAMNINIIIVFGTRWRGYTMHCVPWIRNVTRNEIIIWKEGGHYDGIKPSQKHCSELNGPVFTGEKFNLEDRINPSQKQCPYISGSFVVRYWWKK